MTASVSVIIATWQRPHQLERCLWALLEQRRAAEEVLVVTRPDDVQTHRVLEAASWDPLTLRPVAVTEPGVVAALGAGLDASRTEVVALTDDDATPSPDWVARIAAHFDHNPQLGALGGKDRLAGYADAPVPSERVGKVHWSGRSTGEHHQGIGGPQQTQVLKGVNMAFRRSAVVPIGFDPLLRGGGAQPHWEFGVCLGIGRAGWDVVYDPAVLVDHDEGPRFGQTQRGFEDLSHLTAAAHNQTYAMIRWLSPWRKPIALAYELLVGARIAPGVITALEQGVRTRQWRRVLTRLTAATRGRVAAVGTYLGVLCNRH